MATLIRSHCDLSRQRFESTAIEVDRLVERQAAHKCNELFASCSTWIESEVVSQASHLELHEKVFNKES
jgi:hypothetical protein